MCNLFNCCLPYFSFSHYSADNAQEREPLLTHSADRQTPIDNEPEWLQQCRTWANQPDAIEVRGKRQQALRKIIECTEKQWSTLDLSHIGLVELPPRLPPDITKLICNNNALTVLPEHIPQGVLAIKASHNHLSAITEFPPNLQYADFSHNRISLLNDLPPFLETLDLSYNLLVDVPAKINEHLRSLNLSHNKLTSLPRLCHKWPRSLQVDVSANDFLFITRIGWKHDMKQPGYRGPEIRFEPQEPEKAPLQPIVHHHTRTMKAQTMKAPK